ncbi:MAG: hypothetical protein ACYDDF_03385 [Thermoplasmatota archaeon]
MIQNSMDVSGRPPSGLYFNKVMSLLHRRLKAERIDLGLPHCWYRYGDEVVRQWMPSAVYWDHESPVSTRVFWIGDAPSSSGSEAARRKVIDAEVKQIGAEYRGQGGVERAVNDVYSYAPFEFQRAFREWRRETTEVHNWQAGHGGPAGIVLAGKFRTTLAAFPKEEFPECADRSRAILSAVGSLLDARPSELQMAGELAEQFWQFFCYYLRLHPKGHENVASQTLDLWRAELDAQTLKFDTVFAGHLAQIAEVVPEIRTSSDLSFWLAETEPFAGNIDEMLARTDNAFVGLAEFSRESKKGYAP